MDTHRVGPRVGSCERFPHGYYPGVPNLDNVSFTVYYTRSIPKNGVGGLKGKTSLEDAPTTAKEKEALAEGGTRSDPSLSHHWFYHTVTVSTTCGRGIFARLLPSSLSNVVLVNLVTAPYILDIGKIKYFRNGCPTLERADGNTTLGSCVCHIPLIAVLSAVRLRSPLLFLECMQYRYLCVRNETVHFSYTLGRGILTLKLGRGYRV